MLGLKLIHVSKRGQWPQWNFGARQSTGAPRKTTPRQDRALLMKVRQDRFISARALTQALDQPMGDLKYSDLS